MEEKVVEENGPDGQLNLTELISFLCRHFLAVNFLSYLWRI